MMNMNAFNSGLFLRSMRRMYHSLKVYKYNEGPPSPTLNSLSKTLKYSLRPCSSISCYEDKDPAPLFFDSKIQGILKRLTGFNLQKIFKNRYLENPDSTEDYKFYTKEDLEEEIEESVKEGKRLLQMPPIIKIREPIDEVLSHDPAIQGDETSKIVITDISFGVSDRNRIIVVREPNGILRQATWEERDRMNQIYNPRPGRYYKTPPSFQDEFFKQVLNEENYAFILDFACAHFEPDDPLYHKVTRETYEHIKKRSNFEALHSTRHYGPMCFYFAWNKKIDNLLVYYIHKERLQVAADMINLYYILHVESKSKDMEQSAENSLNFIKKYIEEDGMMKSNLEMAVQVYQEAVRAREELEKTIKASHGLS